MSPEAADGDVQQRLEQDHPRALAEHRGAEPHQPVERVEDARLRVGEEVVAAALVRVPQRQLAGAQGVHGDQQVAPVLVDRVPAEEGLAADDRGVKREEHARVQAREPAAPRGGGAPRSRLRRDFQPARSGRGR